MISGQGCGEKILLLLFATMCVGVTLKAVLCIAALDNSCYAGRFSERIHLMILICGEAAYRCGVTETARCPMFITGLLGIVTGCLLAACVMDVKESSVYQFVWWIGGGAGCLLLLCQCVGYGVLLQMLLFCLLQELFFAKMYGRADCHAFSVCSMIGAAFGLELSGFLIHMLLAFGLLGVVQGLRHNIAGNGNLKRPVPFLPYISVALLLQMLFGFVR